MLMGYGVWAKQIPGKGQKGTKSGFLHFRSCLKYKDFAIISTKLV